MNNKSVIILLNTSSSALTGHLPPHGEVAHFNAPSTWREGVAEGRVRGKFSRGFTLIELLVMVLIIGILTAIALPQYQIAVAKSRIVSLMPTVKSIALAQEEYYLANGTYTQNWDDLTLKVPGEKNPVHKSIIMLPNNGSIGLATVGVSIAGQLPGVTFFSFYKNTSFAFKGKRSCYAAMDNDFANKVCQKLTGKQTSDSNNGPNTDYIYHF